MQINGKAGNLWDFRKLYDTQKLLKLFSNMAPLPIKWPCEMAATYIIKAQNKSFLRQLWKKKSNNELHLCELKQHFQRRMKTGIHFYRQISFIWFYHTSNYLNDAGFSIQIHVVLIFFFFIIHKIFTWTFKLYCLSLDSGKCLILRWGMK